MNIRELHARLGKMVEKYGNTSLHTKGGPFSENTLLFVDDEWRTAWQKSALPEDMDTYFAKKEWFLVDGNNILQRLAALEQNFGAIDSATELHRIAFQNHKMHKFMKDNFTNYE